MNGESLQRVAKDHGLARRAGFWWGFAEGLFFFIVPDVYISFAALFSLRAASLSWLTSIAGSTVAVAIICVCMIPLHIDYISFLVAIPGISSDLLQRVGRSLASDGLPYTPLLMDRRLAPMELSPEVRRDIDAQRVKLAGAELSSTADERPRLALKQAIDEAFVFGFRLVMLTSLCLALASAFVAFIVIENK